MLQTRVFLPRKPKYNLQIDDGNCVKEDKKNLRPLSLLKKPITNPSDQNSIRIQQQTQIQDPKFYTR